MVHRSGSFSKSCYSPDFGVYDLASFRDALAAYNYAVDFAVGSDDLIQIILNQSGFIKYRLTLALIKPIEVY